MMALILNTLKMENNMPNNSTKPITNKTYFTGTVLYHLISMLLSIPLFMLMAGLSWISHTKTILILGFVLQLVLVSASAFFSKQLLAKYYQIHIEHINNIKLTIFVCMMSLLLFVLFLSVLFLIGGECQEFLIFIVVIIAMALTSNWQLVFILLVSIILGMFMIFIGFVLADRKAPPNETLYHQKHQLSKQSFDPVVKSHFILSLAIKGFFIIFIGLIVLVLSLSLRYYLHYNSRYETFTEIRYEYSNKVKNNPFFVAELLLNHFHQRDKPATPFAKSQLNHSINYYIDRLPDPSTHPAVIIKSRHNKLNESELQKLMKWVENGGHLVTFHVSKINLANWQKMQQQLTTLQANNASVNQIKNDKVIKGFRHTARLSGLHQITKYLDLYSVFDYVNKTDEEHLPATIKFDDYLDGLGLAGARERDENYHLIKKDTTRQSDEIERQANIRHRLEHLYQKSNTAFLTNETGDVFMISRSGNVKPSLFYALNPQAKPASYLKLANISQIRQYLTEQQVILQKRIEFLKTNNIQKDNLSMAQLWSGYYNSTMNDLNTMNALEGALSVMLKMEDYYLQELFVSQLNQLIFDSHYGKGRLTVISNDVLANPEIDLGVITNLNAHNQGDLDNNDIHNIFNMNKVLGGYPNRRNWSGIYTKDNAKFILELTKHDSQVWFLSDDDRIWTGAIAENIPFLSDTPNITNVEDNQTPIDLIYRTISSDDYAQKKAEQKKELKDKFDLP